MTRVFTGLLVAMLLAGCSTSKRTYDITIRNELDKPVTIWLPKDGSPGEEKWRSPEEVAAMKDRDQLVVPGVVVQPGKTASTGPVEGSVRSGTNGVLRVYVGETSMAGILKQRSGRIDLKLDPGINQLVLR